MTLPLEIEITEENVGRLKNKGERAFATACVRQGISLTHQIPVGNSIIDFRTETPSGKCKLVEVTISKRSVAKRDDRKKKQIEDMENSGMPYVLICKRELKNIKDNNKKYSKK
jgi:hypothetical protein